MTPSLASLLEATAQDCLNIALSKIGDRMSYSLQGTMS